MNAPFIDFSPNRPYAPPRAAWTLCAALRGSNNECTRGVDRFAGFGVVAVRGSPIGPESPPQSIEDQVLGWIKVYDYQPATAPITVDARVLLARAALHRAALCQLDAGQLSAEGRAG